jgi:hypothetical protein
MACSVLPAAANSRTGAAEAQGRRLVDPPSGAAAMVASAVYPGLGQLINGAERKSAIVSAIEVFLVAGLLVEDRRTRNSLRLFEQTGDETYYDEYSEHYDRRQTLVWWVAVAALYGLTDAYVDAHLADFEVAPLAGPDGAVESGHGEGAALRIGVALRF